MEFRARTIDTNTRVGLLFFSPFLIFNFVAETVVVDVAVGVIVVVVSVVVLKSTCLIGSEMAFLFACI